MRVLADKYRLVSRIASGGMAEVHLGKVVGLGGFERVVAIKLMHPHLLRERDYVAMFLDEARLAARIRHPNVVATLDVDECDAGPFIVMEFIEGFSLSEVLRALRRRGEVIPLPVAMRIFDDLASGLHAAHELRGSDKQPLNLVHRDVSPQNVMVGTDGISRISDFGVARAEVRISSTRSGQLKGKLGYLPPEQVRAEPIDRRADIYAAGVVLWEMLTGARLFTAPDEAALLFRLVQGAKEGPQDLNPNVPAAIDAVCMKALALSPADRYATAHELAAALERACAESGVGVASARATADFVAGLDLQLPSLSDPPPADGALEEARSDAHHLSERHGSGVSGARAAEPAPATGASSGTSAALATSVVTSPRRRPRLLVVGAIALTMGGIAAGLVFTRALGPSTLGPAAQEPGDSPGEAQAPSELARAPGPAPASPPSPSDSEPSAPSEPSLAVAPSGSAPPSAAPPADEPPKEATTAPEATKKGAPGVAAGVAPGAAPKPPVAPNADYEPEAL